LGCLSEKSYENVVESSLTYTGDQDEVKITHGDPLIMLNESEDDEYGAVVDVLYMGHLEQNAPYNPDGIRELSSRFRTSIKGVAVFQTESDTGQVQRYQIPIEY
jgi:hypothetical protein